MRLAEKGSLSGEYRCERTGRGTSRGIVEGVKRTPRSGRGSNQYQSKGRGTVAEQATRAGVAHIRDAVELQSIGNAFLDTEALREQAKSLGSKRSLDALIQRSSSDVSQRIRVAGMKSCPPEVLEVLAEDGDSTVRGYVAANPSTPDHVLIRLSREPDRGVRRWVCRNPRTGPWTETLAADDDKAVREQLARNVEIPVEIARQLAKDPFRSVRGSLARTTTDTALLTELSADNEAAVRGNVGKNPHTPPEVVERLSTDRAASVRHRVASRDNLDAGIRERLADDPDDRVRRAARAQRSS